VIRTEIEKKRRIKFGKRRRLERKRPTRVLEKKVGDNLILFQKLKKRKE